MIDSHAPTSTFGLRISGNRRTMRIILVNWARIWDGAGYGGGVNGYCQALALSLQERGHDVVSLFGGIGFARSPTFDKTTPCFVKRHDDWFGVRVFEIVNSPIMAPSIIQFDSPMAEVSCPELELEVGRLFDLLKPDVVHFNNIEGFSLGCIDAARRAGARIIFSLHNYHTICPQVYLMQGHRRVCYDYRGGHACVGCIKAIDPVRERHDRARRAYAEANPHIVKMRAEIRGEWGGFKHEFTWPVRVAKRSLKLVNLRVKIALAQREAANPEPGSLVGYPAATEFDVTCPRPVPAPTAQKLKELGFEPHQAGPEQVVASSHPTTTAA